MIAQTDAGWRGLRLTLARVAWLLLAALALTVFAISVPARFHELLTVASGPERVAGQLRFTVSIEAQYVPLQLYPEEAHALEQLGLSVGLYAGYVTGLEVAFALGSAVVGGMIFWRRSDDRVALVSALALLLAGPYFTSTMTALIRQDVAWRFPAAWVLALSALFIVLFTLLFPDGRFVPRWTRPLAYGWIVWMLSLPFIRAINPFNWPLPSLLVMLSVLVGVVVCSQVYRYVRVSTPVQQQQTKWVVFGLSVAGLMFMLLNLGLPELAVPLLVRPGGTLALYNLITVFFFYLALFLPSLAITAAILRYRLWDIDLLIRRTLIYGVLTAALAFVYFGSVVVLQAVFSAVGGQRSELVTILSTLAIAALFAPLRRRVQNAIDRRFYRRKYDAAKTLAAFSATVRDEVDLDRLTERLVEVVQETMQPEHVSLWLRQPQRKQDIGRR